MPSNNVLYIFCSVSGDVFWQMGYSKIYSQGQNLCLVMKVSYGLLIFLIVSFISLNTPMVIYTVFLMMPISDVFDGIYLIVSALIHGRLLPHVSL